ncbi:MAG: right-handed parallel beta-helix repeat-containing protein [Myxococcales bacterium]|nr:right-handed parallel beta-helix repeat-containing protein [Myxococcales bacterium]
MEKVLRIGIVLLVALALGACGSSSGSTNAGDQQQSGSDITAGLDASSDGGDATPLTDTGADASLLPPEKMARWSDPATWGGELPKEGDEVVIPAGTEVLLDVDPPSLASLTIDGRLRFDERDTTLRAGYILVRGALEIGDEGVPFAHKATITLTDTDTERNVMQMMGTRGILVMGGRLDLHGQAPSAVFTKLDQHLENGATTLTVLDASGWKVGDEVVVAPTDFYGVAQSQTLTLSKVDGTSLTTTSPIVGFRWGLLQYVSQDGMSLTPDPSVTAPTAPEGGTAPLVLDERAEVGNLTRNIVIEAPDDELWRNQGFGAQLMVMTLQSLARIDGVELRRVGQAGRLGRYPMHWHRLSYDDAGSELGDATGHYIRNSTIHQSANRCVTIHATNGVQVSRNICFDIKGHGIFFEDAVERRNRIEGNLVLRVRFPAPSQTLKLHEREQPGIESGSSGIWVSNPDNTVRNNTLADCEGFGLWMAFPKQPVGVSKLVAIKPYRLLFGDFDGNTLHSNRGRGATIDNVEDDDAGKVVNLQYASTTDGEELVWPYPTLRRFSIRGWTLYKNGVGNFWNRVVWPSYTEFVSADGEGKFFNGSGSDGLISRSLIIGTSLNDFSERPNAWVGNPIALATYHSTFDMRDNVIVNFPLVFGKPSGAFASDDYYIRPVEKGHIRNSNNLLIKSHPGHRSKASVDEGSGFALGYDYYVFASALWDPYGLWGPAGNWSVYDEPFLTYGANCTPLSPPGQLAISCDGRYYGVDAFVVNQANEPWDDLMAIEIQRYTDGTLGEEVGTWRVEAGQSDWLLAHMRHFAVRQNGFYRLSFPGLEIPWEVTLDLTNIHGKDDVFVLGVPFSGDQLARVYSSTYDYGNSLNDGPSPPPRAPVTRPYTAVESWDALRSSEGQTFWQNPTDHIVWVKISAEGLELPTGTDAPTPHSDQALYNRLHLRVY